MYFNRKNVKNVKPNKMNYGVFINNNMVNFIKNHMEEKLVVIQVGGTVYSIQHPDIDNQYMWPLEFFTDKGVDVI